jgi:HK97 family phage portal protein
MGFLARSLVGPVRSNVAFDENFWPELMSGFKSKSGQSVTIDKALQATAVLSCLRVLSEDTAQVSRGLFRKLKEGGSEEATDHPLYDLLVTGPNDWQTGFEFVEQLVLHCGLAGRFIAFKNVVRGKISELVPIEPACARIEVDEFDRLHYFIKSAKSGQEREFPPSAIWHVKGPSWNGWDGLEVMKLAREAIGLSIATEESHSLLHANGGQSAGIISMDSPLSKLQFTQLRSWVEENMVGASRFKPFILDRGAKWLQTQMTGVDAQHLETRRFQIEEVCRALRVMPIMVGYSDKTATFASSSEMFQAHVKFSLGGWFRRIEESVAKNLLSSEERKSGLYFKFLPISLLRGNAKERGEFYWKLWQMGALNSNEVRAYEELNPYEGGELYRVPVNTMDATEPPEVEDEETDDPIQPQARGSRMNVGRVLSSRNEKRIRDADGMLNEVLAELDGDDASASTSTPAPAEKPQPTMVSVQEVLTAMNDLASRRIHVHMNQQQTPINVNVQPTAVNVTSPDVHNHFVPPETTVKVDVNVPPPPLVERVATHNEEGRLTGFRDRRIVSD